MKALGVCIGAAALLTSPAFGQASQGGGGTPAGSEAKAFTDCYGAIHLQMVAQRVTPERYQMVAEGACLDEERATLDAAEAYFKAMDGGHSDVTARTMQNLRAFHRQFRVQQISQYTVMYETAQKPRGNQP